MKKAIILLALILLLSAKAFSKEILLPGLTSSDCITSTSITEDRSCETLNRLFTEINCEMCHSIDGSNSNMAPDLSGIRNRMAPKDVIDWLSKHLFIEPRFSMFGSSGPKCEDITGFTIYLFLCL